MTKKEQAIARLQEMDDEGVFDAILDDTPANDDDHDDEPDVDSATSDFSADEDPEKAEMRARLSALEAERRHERAVNFARGEVAANRIFPHEEALAADVMFSAMSDDADLGDAVNFSQSGKAVKGTREAMVRAAYAQRKPHAHTRDLIRSGPADFSGGHALDNGGGGEETPEQKQARVDKRLANTPFGQAILARRRGSARA